MLRYIKNKISTDLSSGGFFIFVHHENYHKITVHSKKHKNLKLTIFQ